MRHMLLALLLCLPVMAVAQSEPVEDLAKSGDDYLRICEAPIQGGYSDRALESLVWMDGVLNGFKAYEAGSYVKLFDVPDGVTTEQLQKVVAKYMKDRPMRLHYRTSALVLWALRDAYPPKKK